MSNLVRREIGFRIENEKNVEDETVRCANNSCEAGGNVLPLEWVSVSRRTKDRK